MFGAAGNHWIVWSWTVFVLVRSLSVIYPPAPGFPMDLVAIRLFGPAMGLLAAECGIMLGAAVAFAAGRAASPSLAKRLVGKWRVFEYLRGRFPIGSMTGRQQFTKWLEIRLWTNPLFDPICYLAGLTSVAFWPYFLGSLVGNLPSTALFFAAEAIGPLRSIHSSLVTALLFCGFVIYVAEVFLRVPVDDA